MITIGHINSLRKLRELRKFSILLLSLLVMSCSFDMDFVDDSSLSGTDAEEYSYISLGLSMDDNATGSTRAALTGGTRAETPTGGEYGDYSYETGTEEESTIKTAAVFLYKSETDGDDDKGINSAASTEVNLATVLSDDASIEELEDFFSDIEAIDKTDYPSHWVRDDDNWPYDYTLKSAKIKLSKSEYSDGTYHVIVVANPSTAFLTKVTDLLKDEQNKLTLGDIRDYEESAAWSTSYTDFVMSSEMDAIVTLDEDNSERFPAKVKVDLERLAARIDYKAEATSFEVEDERYARSTVEIKGAAIVNNLTAGSYMLKRVSEDVNDVSEIPTSITYLGDENVDVDVDGLATNYVIDPWTPVKDLKTTTVTIGGTSGKAISELYGEYYPGEATGEQVNPSHWSYLTDGNTVEVTDDNGTTWNRIGYTMENTTFAQYTSKQYATAVVFKALFTPAEGVINDSFYESKGFSYTSGSTFFMWNNELYATAEDMMAAVYPETFVVDDRFTNAINQCSNWGDVEEFANTLSDDDPTGYKNYLLNKVSDDGKFSTTTLTWDYYMRQVIGYNVDTNGEFSIDEIGDPNSLYTSTRAALSAATNGAVSTYENAQCYYTWWIRHSNNQDDETSGVMEFSIVRNNIYQVDLVSAYTIGGDIPKEGIQCDIRVSSWSRYKQEDLNL